jgi:hypothetical protein
LLKHLLCDIIIVRACHLIETLGVWWKVAKEHEVGKGDEDLEFQFGGFGGRHDERESRDGYGF